MVNKGVLRAPLALYEAWFWSHLYEYKREVVFLSESKIPRLNKMRLLQVEEEI